MRRAALLAQLDEMVRQKAAPFNGLRSCEPECLQRLGCRKKKASGKCKVSASVMCGNNTVSSPVLEESRC